jgi:hypothetical protein
VTSKKHLLGDTKKLQVTLGRCQVTCGKHCGMLRKEKFIPKIFF